MKKKILLLIMATFLITGCDAKYKLVITGNKIDESITLLEKNELISKTNIDQTLEDIIATNSDVTSDFAAYNFDKIEGLVNSGLILSNSYASHTFYNARSVILNRCYDNGSLIITTDKITILTSNDFKCFDLVSGESNITFVISTNYKVTANNADLIEGDTYTWNIDPNISDNHIAMAIDKTKTSGGKVITPNSSIFGEEVQLLLIIAGISLFMGAFGYIMYARYKKINEL